MAASRARILRSPLTPSRQGSPLTPSRQVSQTQTATSPQPPSPPILELNGKNYYYGFSIRYSGERKKTYFLKETERPDLRISVSVAESVISQFKPPEDEFGDDWGSPETINLTLAITTQVTRTSSSALSQQELRELEIELQNNIAFLQKYLIIDRADLAPDLVAKLNSLEARNNTITSKLESEKKMSYTVMHSFDYCFKNNSHVRSSDEFAPLPPKTKLFFDGFIITLMLRSMSL